MEDQIGDALDCVDRTKAEYASSAREREPRSLSKRARARSPLPPMLQPLISSQSCLQF